MGCPFSQGIGLRPQPWARVSRPVGPERSIDKNRSMSSSPRPCGAGLQTPPSRPGVETRNESRALSKAPLIICPERFVEKGERSHEAYLSVFDSGSACLAGSRCGRQLLGDLHGDSPPAG